MLQLVLELPKALHYPFAFLLLLRIFPPGRGFVDIVNGTGLWVIRMVSF